MPAITLHQLVAAARGRRRELGWSQEDFARRAGVSRTWVHDFEQGTGGASIEAVLRALDVLGLPLDLARDKPPAVASEAESVVIDLDALLDQYRK